jgi:signal transduction histidine kinase
MGIRRRLLLSFIALFAAVLVATALVSTLLVARAVEHRHAEQVQNLGRLFSDYRAVSVGTLEYVKRAYGAESVSIGRPGAVPDAEGVFRAPTYDGLELVMRYSPEVVSREKAEAVRPFVFLGIGGLALVAVLGYVSAHAIARPLERLAEQAKALPAGRVDPVGGGAELDHLVEAMNRMLEEVRRAERLIVMGRMAAGVAHEVRNPLSSMKMTVQMLREGAKDREAYDLLLREIERLELTAAELAGASQPLKRERIRLEGVVEEVLELMRLRLDHLSIRLEKRLTPGQEVEIDVARFKSCVMNLVLNGAQAMPAGGPLAVEVGPRDGRVRFSVTDAGGGVPEEVRARVFEPFVTTKADGVGLGLALTRRIVEDHGGSIGFEPAAKGTTFWIELPHG